MSTPAIAPNFTTYATYSSYITPAQYLAAPTGVDVSQLLPGDSSIDNMAALAMVIARASSRADRYCKKVLAATVDIQADNYRVRRDGEIWIPLPYSPVIQVNSVSVGRDPSCLQKLGNLERIRFKRSMIKVPLWGCGYNGYNGAPRQFPYQGDGTVYAQTVWVNGFANTLAAGSSDAGASSLDVMTTVGVAPGLALNINDGASTETIVVGPGYTLDSTTVPTVAPLLYAHGQGVAVTALPPYATDAIIDLTTARIKTRGAEGLLMAAIDDEPEKEEKPGTADLLLEEIRAFEALGDLVRAR